MHFFYIDETGDTGEDLLNDQQPIFVMGGISVSDEKWNPTQQAFGQLIEHYFEGATPAGFELHAHELLSPKGDGPFEGHERERRNKLALDVLSLIKAHSHQVHAIAFCKKTLHGSICPVPLVFHPQNAYLLGIDYLITQINDHVKYRLGRSARGMIILDKKEQHHDDIEKILYNRRFGTTATHRVKWIVEFSYPIDSNKNPMIQISDLAIYCIRKFLEIEHGYADNWKDEAKSFIANCYKIIDDRFTIKKGIIERKEPKLKELNNHISQIVLKPSTRWRSKYKLND